MTNRWANPINNNILRDLEGTVLASGSVAFYAAGTSTPLAVYSDPELTISLGSFINADAFGLLPDFHLASGTQYKMVSYDAVGGAGGAGAIKWTRDDVFGLDSSVDSRLDSIESTIDGLDIGRNSIMNGGCSVINRGVTGAVIAAPSLTTGYVEGQCKDVFAVASTVTAGTITIGYSTDVESGAYCEISGYSTTISSAVLFRYPIVSGEASRFINKQATFRAKVWHDTGSDVSFSLSVYTLNVRDTDGGITSILAGPNVTVPTETWTEITLTVPDMGNCSNGVRLFVGASGLNVTNKNIRCTSVMGDLGGVLSAFTETDPAIADGGLNAVDLALLASDAAETAANSYTDTEITDLAKRDAGSPWLNGIGAMQVLTGSGNFTVPDGVYRLKSRQCGGGAGGVGSSGTGGNGGTTTFGSVTTTGGIGSTGLGGTASGGTVNINGGGRFLATGTASGNGGSSVFGVGPQGVTSESNGSSSNVPGTGGSGAGFDPGGGVVFYDGGAPAAYAEHVHSVSPGDLIAYAVGAGGTAGSGTRTGGAGAAGVIVVEY